MVAPQLFGLSNHIIHLFKPHIDLFDMYSLAMALISGTRTTLSIFFSLTFLFIHQVNSTSFTFRNFNPNMAGISFQGDAFTSSGVLQLTRNQLDDNLTNSAGRASYIEPIHIWDSKTGAIASFISRFSFIAKDVPDWSAYGDGLTFFLAPVESEIPPGSGGGYLALFSPDNANNSSKSRVVAVEFDSFSDPWDPGYDHVGIDVNSIASAAEMKWNSNIYSGGVVDTWVTYESGAKNLSVFVSDPVIGIYSLSYSVDLRDVLPEWVQVGFSAATGTAAQTNKILFWEFKSNF